MEKIIFSTLSIILLALFSTVMVVVSVLSNVQFLSHLLIDISLVLTCFIWSRHRKTHFALLALFPSIVILHYVLAFSGISFLKLSPNQWNIVLVILSFVQTLSAVFMIQCRQLFNLSELLNLQKRCDRIQGQVDVLYASLHLLLLSILSVAAVFPASAVMQVCWAVFSVLLLILDVLALVRSCKGGIFLLMKKYEDKIIQSSVPVPNCTLSTDYQEVYNEIFDRLVSWLSSEKPYLNENFSIVDAAKHVFTNKVYLSRAVNRSTGKNFCQFINSYRIQYSKQLFLSNPELKVSDLSVMSGFHNPVTYNMAFQMIEHLTPGEWCNDQRSKLLKMKK